MENLKAKLFIKGKIELVTGLHIGGSPTALNIGGIDTNVIKTPSGIPFIPGSTLKGKLRALYGLYKGYLGISRPKEDNNPENHYDDEDISMKRLFGTGIVDGGEKGRLIIRDSFLDITDFSERRNIDFFDLEFDFTEGKWENNIGRIDSKSIPRQIERVPAGSRFIFELILNIFDEMDVNSLNILLTAIKLLQDDYIGGSGSRGYGQIKFYFDNITLKPIRLYESGKDIMEIQESVNIFGDNSNLISEIKHRLQL